ncbi:MAG: NapC/NirT family cytochrome c [Wenzhouxiangella sp.]
MQNTSQKSPRRSRSARFTRAFWHLFSRPSTRIGAGLLVVIGLVLGVMSFAGFNTVVAYTNTVEFCTSCHEMEAFVYPDYAGGRHYTNSSGVRATCADCHVPQAFWPKMVAKTRASVVELPSHFRGKLDTEEKFEAHKAELAERVWDRMQGNDSRECRDCHSWEAMSEAVQPNRAWREHVTGREAGETCIDCHKGVAHSLPAAYLEIDDEDLDFDF